MTPMNAEIVSRKDAKAQRVREGGDEALDLVEGPRPTGS